MKAIAIITGQEGYGISRSETATGTPATQTAQSAEVLKLTFAQPQGHRISGEIKIHITDPEWFGMLKANDEFEVTIKRIK